MSVALPSALLPKTLEFDFGVSDSDSRRSLAAGAVLLAGFAVDQEAHLLDCLRAVTARAPFRHMTTPGGKTMSVAMSNCGDAGWISERNGYRYGPIDPQTQLLWPKMPQVFAALATAAAGAAGYTHFIPDACLINRYAPGSRLSLHQDRDERDFSQPIVSVSLGLPAIFLWGGQVRAQRPERIPLLHGDVVVWGGPARMTFHGVETLKEGKHTLTGACRFNLTFRRAG